MMICLSIVPKLSAHSLTSNARKRALRDTLPAYRASDSDITVDVS